MPPPLAFPNSAPTAFQDIDGVRSTQAELERLTQGARNAEQAGSRCQKVLEDVQKLLDGENITQFKFKRTKRSAPADATSQLPEPKLSSFAKLVYDQSNVEYKYADPPPGERPESARKQSMGNQQNPRQQRVVLNPAPAQIDRTPAQQRVILGSAPTQLDQPPSQPRLQAVQTPSAKPMTPHPSSTPTTQPQHRKVAPVSLIPMIPRGSQSSQVSQDGLRLPVSKQVTPQQSKVKSSGMQQTPRAYVPLANLTPAQRAEYQRVPDSSMASASSQNQSAYLTNRRIISQDQRAKNDMAATELQSQLQDIFEAEDQMQPDTSGEVKHVSRLFVTRNTGDGPALILSADAQLTLESIFNRVVTAGRLDDIDVEALVRVQRICERSISALSSGSLSIGDDWSTEDVREWMERVSNAESGLIAGRILLHIMTGGSHRKEVQSESSLTTVLDAIRIVVETCIIPVTEERASAVEKAKGDKGPPTNPKFIVAVQSRQELLKVLQAANKLLRLLGRQFMRTEADESAISSLEYLCKMLIFGENATNERDSALGMQNYEALRKTAMDAMAKIFTKYPKERSPILDEILMSLEKLPASKQGARQFAISGTKPIQLVSALLMRLVQTSATPSGKATADDSDDESNEESEPEDSEDESSDDSASPQKKKARKSKVKEREAGLLATLKPLQEGANNHALYIVKNLLSRALGTSKSSDEPYRKLLDIFVDDFINVLGFSDWPAAEVLLRALVVRLINIVELPKASAPFRTLALELLGTIGSAIIDIQSYVSNAAKALDTDDEISQRLVRAARDCSNHAISASELTSFEGPYRIVIEYLHGRNLEDPQLYTARGYHLVQWAEQVCGIERDDNATAAEKKASLDLQAKIKHQMDDRHWLESNFEFEKVVTAQGKLASKIVTANSQLCRAFPRIFSNILKSMRSEQPTVRSRSLKSVTALLEQDPSILDRDVTVMRQIVYCMGDSSSLVRDSALQLVQKCIALRPALELQVYEKVVERTTDTNSPVRKRAMAFLKQVYLNGHGNEVKAKISNAMISRIHDVDENVAEVARTTIEEIWFSAFRDSRDQESLSVDSKLQMQSHAALIVQTVDLGANVAMVLEALMRELLIKSKQAADNTRICKALVAVLFEGTIDNTEIPDAPSQSAILRTLTVFAKAGPKLFVSSQLELLEPYARNLKTTDDLEIYPFVVTILQYTLRVVPGINNDFLSTLQTHLLQSVQKLPKNELSVVAPCLWTIVEVLDNHMTRLIPFVVSVVRGVAQLQDTKLDEANKGVAKACKLLTIMGQFGKACQLDPYLASFTAQPQLTSFKGKSVAGMMVEIGCNFTKSSQPQVVRQAALEAICAIGYSNPNTFFREDVVSAIEIVFKNQNSDLESVLLSGLEVFIRAGEKGAQDDAGPELGSGVDSGTERLGNTYQATGSDVAYTSLSQRFMDDFLRIALTSMDDVALCAGKIIASINTQGIAHPGKSAPGLVALQTCPNSSIAKMAFLSYKQSWEKHESTLEKTLMLSIQQSFKYQRDVVRSTSGCTGHPPSSKLHYFWDVLKTGKAKPRAKFFTNLCAALDFDLAKFTSPEAPNQHLQFVRFCVETIGFLDYDNVGEILHIMSGLEKVFTGTGTTIAQLIESEVLKLNVPSSDMMASSDAINNGINGDANGGAPAFAVAADAEAIAPDRMRQLVTSAQILSLIWETRTLLRRKWMLTKYIGNAKLAAKDDKNKASPAPTASAIADTYQSKINAIIGTAEDLSSQQATCRAFVELISVDNEAKVADGVDGDDMDVDDDDDTRSEGSASKSPAPRGKKRKSTDGNKGGPPKKKGRPRKSGSVSVADEDGDWD